MRLVSRTWLYVTVCAGAALPAPAMAQHIDRIVTFGDSYADDGNAFQLAGSAPPIIYSTGRFSGGTNYVDTLSQLLRAPVENFAIGGARTNTGNQSFGLPGFTTEVAIFGAGGGGVFPTVDPTFDEGDLVTISIGGNDARAFQQGGGTPGEAPAAAATAVAFAEAGMDALVAAGAPTISFLAGDTSRLPEVNFYPDPAAARAARSAYSTAFNEGIQDVLAGYAADGVIAHYLDLNAILDRIEAAPSAYGFTGIACPAFPAPAGPGNPGSLACIEQSTANQFVFYGDQLHLTSAGFAVIGRYVAAQLAAPLTLQAPADLGFDTGRQFGRTLAGRVALADTGGGMRVFVAGDTFSRDYDMTDGNDAFRTDSYGLTAGAEFGVGGGVVGLAANLSRPRARFDGGTAGVRSRSMQIGAYAGFGFGGGIAQAHLGYGSDEHEIEREGVIDSLAAEPDGSHVTAGAKLGYLIPAGPVRIGPVAAIDYVRAKVDGYTEEGDAALALNVSSQKLSALIGQIGVEVRGQGVAGAVRPFVSALLEKDLDGDSRLIRFAQTSSPGIVNQWTVERSSKAYGRVSGGASFPLMAGATADVAASSTLGRDEGDELSAHLGLRVGF